MLLSYEDKERILWDSVEKVNTYKGWASDFTVIMVHQTME